MDKEFDKLFSQVSYSHSMASVWNDFIHMAALAIANGCNYQQSREDTYMDIVKRYTKNEVETIAQMLTRVVTVLDENREQDFLGQLYMEYKLGDVKKGQYFTPYNIADMMARITGVGDSGKPYETVNDPTSGSGVMLIATVNKVLRQGGNPHTDLFVVAQDLDPIIAKMCYIQLSLLGAAGYVVIGDSLAKPLAGNVLFPPKDAWCTPMFYHQVWHWRRLFEIIEGELM